MQFAPCRHLTQPWQCDSQKTRNATRLKCCACHAKWRRRSPKCCACLETARKYCARHTKRLSTRYETCWTVTKCHACHAKRGYAALETSKSDHFCRTRQRHGHAGLTDGCDRKRNVERTHPQPPDPQSETGTLATHSGKLLGLRLIEVASFHGC